MHDHMLAILSLERAKGSHLRAARAGTVARHAVIHMPRMETERAVVAMLAARGQRADQSLAMPTPEDLLALAIARLRGNKGFSVDLLTRVRPTEFRGKLCQRG